LGVVDVDSFKDEMTYEAFLKWIDYFDKRPPGWRDDDRIFKLMQAWGVKEKPQNVFQSLKPIYSPPVKPEPGQLNMSKFKGSLMFNKILRAKNGDQLDVW
jgi:hypothetical protein